MEALNVVNNIVLYTWNFSKKVELKCLHSPQKLTKWNDGNNYVDSCDYLTMYKNVYVSSHCML